MSQAQRFAAIDIGSNSILLTIVERAKPYKILIDQANVTGLSKGLSKDGLIQNDRLENSLKVLSKYRALLDEYKPAKIHVAATEALRKAKNGSDVKKQIEARLQLPVDLISGEREAELSFWSVQKEYADRQTKKLVFDIGGASTELAYGGENGIEKRVSLKVGSVLMTEKFSLKSKSNGEEALRYVHSLLDELKWGKIASVGIGVAGTMTTLMSMEKQMKVYDRAKVHGQKITKDRTKFWMHEVLSRDVEARSEIVGLPQDRADIFGGGVVIIQALVAHFGWNEIVCMDSGIRFGLIFEMLNCDE